MGLIWIYPGQIRGWSRFWWSCPGQWQDPAIRIP